MDMTGGIIVLAIAKPSRRIITALRQLVLGRKCVRCERTQVVETPAGESSESTFVGQFRFGLCPRCYSQYRARRIPLSRTAAARYDASLIRLGKLVPRDVVALIREDDGFRRAAEAAKKGD